VARRGLLGGGCVTKLLPIVLQCSPHRSKYYRHSIYFDHVSRSHNAIMRVDGILWGITCHNTCAILRLLYPCITTCKEIVSDVRLLNSRAQLIQATYYPRLFSTKLLLSAYSRHRGWNRDNFEWILSGFRGLVAFRFLGLITGVLLYGFRDLRDSVITPESCKVEQ
jgi:hypothetical protein